jgi:CheY-like chemotaxis protein
LNQAVKVLIVDDEASQRSGLAAMVSSWGMIPETAGDGHEAIRKMADFSPDVILTDLNMPGLDGFGFLKHPMATSRRPSKQCMNWALTGSSKNRFSRKASKC